MYYSLRGTLIAADGRSAAVECGGVGYLCTVSAQTYSQLPEPGEEVLLYTHLSVREDAMELYGFGTEKERNCFQLLIGVSGVGPKAALSILSATTPEGLATAIITGDEKALTVAQGIGKKIAQRILLELKDKLAKTSKEMKAVNADLKQYGINLEFFDDKGSFMGIDNLVKPILIARGAGLSLLVIGLGVFGGVLVFGFIGIFLGPVLLALGQMLLLRWLNKKDVA